MSRNEYFICIIWYYNIIIVSREKLGWTITHDGVIYCGLIVKRGSIPVFLRTYLRIIDLARFYSSNDYRRIIGSFRFRNIQSSQNRMIERRESRRVGTFPTIGHMEPIFPLLDLGRPRRSLVGKKVDPKRQNERIIIVLWARKGGHPQKTVGRSLGDRARGQKANNRNCYVVRNRRIRFGRVHRPVQGVRCGMLWPRKSSFPLGRGFRQMSVGVNCNMDALVCFA